MFYNHIICLFYLLPSVKETQGQVTEKLFHVWDSNYTRGSQNSSCECRMHKQPCMSHWQVGVIMSLGKMFWHWTYICFESVVSVIRPKAAWWANSSATIWNCSMSATKQEQYCTSFTLHPNKQNMQTSALEHIFYRLYGFQLRCGYDIKI